MHVRGPPIERLDAGLRLAVAHEHQPRLCGVLHARHGTWPSAGQRSRRLPGLPRDPARGSSRAAEARSRSTEHVTYFVDPGTAEINDRSSTPKRASSGGCIAGTCTCGRTVARSGRSIPRPDGAAPSRRHRSWRGQGRRLRRASSTAWTSSAGCACVRRRAADRLLRLVLARRAPLGDGAGHQARPRSRSPSTCRLHKVYRVRRVGAAARRRLHRHRLRLPQPQLVVRERHAWRSATSTCGRRPRTPCPANPTAVSASTSTPPSAADREALPRPRRAVAHATVRRDRRPTRRG